MQQWLTVIIVLLIIGVLLDGIRRMRQSRRSALKMSLSMHKGINKEDLDRYGSELPNGGARVVSVRKAEEAGEHHKKIQSSRQQQKRPQQPKKQTAGRSQRIPQQVALNLEESVPMLMDSVEEKAGDTASKAANRGSRKLSQSYGRDLLEGVDDNMDENGRIEPQISADPIDIHSDFMEQDDSPEEPGDDKSIAEETVEEEDLTEDADEILGLKGAGDIDFDDFDETEADTHEIHTPQRQQAFEQESSPADDGDVVEEDVDDETLVAENEAEDEAFVDEPADDHYIEPEVVLVINVMAPQGTKLAGGELLQVILDAGMRFGNMDIFHRHAGDDGDGSVLYSMANIVVPGTFDLKNMENMLTPGVSLFLALPLERGNSSLEAFNYMLQTAQAISSRLGAELKDENRSVMTAQTIEHYRQRIRDFERKQLSRAPA